MHVTNSQEISQHSNLRESANKLIWPYILGINIIIRSMVNFSMKQLLQSETKILNFHVGLACTFRSKCAFTCVNDSHSTSQRATFHNHEDSRWVHSYYLSGSHWQHRIHGRPIGVVHRWIPVATATRFSKFECCCGDCRWLQAVI